jgi:hypothetical protein
MYLLLGIVNSDSRGKVEICPRVGGDAGRPLYAEEKLLGFISWEGRGVRSPSSMSESVA